MTNPDREELIALADHLEKLSKVGFGYDIHKIDRAALRKSATALRLSALEAPAAGDGEPVARKRPVAFRVRQHRLSNYYELYTNEKDAQFWADDRGIEYEGLYLVADRFTAPPAEAAMREALDMAFCAMKDLRDGLHREPLMQGRKWVHLGSNLNDAIRKAELALTAPGATTKSDGGGGRARDFSTVAIDENFYFTWPKDGASEVQVQDRGGTKGKSNAAPVASVDANANDDGQRVQTGNNVVTGGESATTNSSPSEPKNYFFENEEDAAEAADNGRNTGGKSYYRPSDPSSTRSEVSVEELAACLRKFVGWDGEMEAARALLGKYRMEKR